MRCRVYSDVKSFYADTYDVLLRHEAQNVIPLGNIIIGNEGRDKTGWRDPVHWFMATVSDDRSVLLTAVMTPPHNLTLYATDNKTDDAALQCLLDGIKGHDIHIPGVMTEKALAEKFAQAFAKNRGCAYRTNKSQRIYELSQVNTDIASVGTVRLATEKDMSFLPYWMKGFDGDCFGDSLATSGNISEYLYRLDRLYVLEDSGMPVTMAKITRELQTTCVIGLVYTPPYFRGRGYATSCVAAVSQIGLDKGYKKTVLYTDLANPTSNSIYMKIGYKSICDSAELAFSYGS